MRVPPAAAGEQGLAFERLNATSSNLIDGRRFTPDRRLRSNGRLGQDMAAIWQQREGAWRLLTPSSFPDEAALHDRIEEAPQLLPLAGSPRVTILGREVRLGTGYADLVGVERSGRPVVVEIKLAKNAEARRAVVAQVLAYAAYLFGLAVSDFEEGVLGGHLRQRGHESAASAVEADDQSGGLELEVFREALAAHLRSGLFRLVFVLDDAPEELVKLVGYLAAVTPELVIDLITVAQYDVGGSYILVPQRVEPERRDQESAPPPQVAKEEHGELVRGGKDFADAIDAAAAQHQPLARRLFEWASSLEREGLAVLSSYHGKSQMTLLPRLPVDDVGLVTVGLDGAGVYLQFWRSVFERRAPKALPRVDVLAPVKVGQGNMARLVTDELLDSVTEAYREARASIRGPVGREQRPDGQHSSEGSQP